MVGAGFMGRGIALQMLTAVPGLRLAAVSNRHLDGARQAYAEAGVEDVRVVETVAQVEDSIARGQYAITDDAMLLCAAEGIDLVLEVTGTVEFAARVVLRAIENRKHVAMMNAELDGTLGPILRVYADRAGVVYTNADGDQPGVIMNLYRFVKGIGVKPVLCGNIKGLHDPYRNPTTQAEFARTCAHNTETRSVGKPGAQACQRQRIREEQHCTAEQRARSRDHAVGPRSRWRSAWRCSHAGGPGRESRG